jgi:hypothetical protein
MEILGYINLGILLVTLGFVIGVYVHTDKKIDKLSGEIKEVDNKLSNKIDDVNKTLTNKIDENNKALTDRMDRLYDILVHMGFREERIRKDKAANE